MNEKGMDLQSAMNEAGALWRACLQTFQENKAILPSWDEGIDQAVGKYVQGLQNITISHLHWGFESERYFGKKGMQVKKDLVVKLLPKEVAGV
ncbi:hypothetical protein ID866_6616 [Astraeus odoratus]|nr:hypothetical protein ID866_6616 [Astraeus odoratus]